MSVLKNKFDKDVVPCKAKSRTVVLAKFEDRYYTKLQQYLPVLKYNSMLLLLPKLLATNVSCNKAAAKALSARPSSLMMNYQLFSHKLVTQASQRMSICCSIKLYMAFAVHLIIGTTCSSRLLPILAFVALPMIPVSFQVLLSLTMQWLTTKMCSFMLAFVGPTLV